MSLVDKTRFRDGHYVGLPADFNDSFVRIRVKLLKQFPGFTGKDLHLADVGCGNGNTVFLLNNDFRFCTGIDLFPENETVFRQTALERNCTNCEFIIKYIEKEEVTEQYDRIVCFEVIEHLRDENSVSQLYRMLKPEGLLAVTVPHKWWIFETHGAHLPFLPWNRVPFFSWLPRIWHEKWANARIYTRKRMIKLLQKHHFTVEYSCLITAPLDVLKDSIFKRFMKKFVFRKPTTSNPFLATNVFVIARKKQMMT